MAFSGIDPQCHKFWRCMCKKPRGNNIICWLYQGLWLHSQREDAAIMMLYRKMKVKVYSPDEDTDYFDIVAGVLQGDTLAPYLCIICLDYVLRTSIDKLKKWFQANKEAEDNPA